MKSFILGNHNQNIEEVWDYLFARGKFSEETLLQISPEILDKISKSHQLFLKKLDENIPIYGVNTGFGDSCHRFVESNRRQLQKNLINYLCCATGSILSEEVSKAILLLRIISLSKGFSGVSEELMERLCLFYNQGWFPVIPREGSLGASGDLIPLSYLGQIIQGNGDVYFSKMIHPVSSLMSEKKLTPYILKEKEGLALVNGTSAMTAIALVNLNDIRFLLELSTLATSWACLALEGRKEAFGKIVNAKAKSLTGQRHMANEIEDYLNDENYNSMPLKSISIKENVTSSFVQDPYSLRCAPQVLGPIWETYEMVKEWMELEMNGVSDNPLIDIEEDQLANGGNFYGSYIAHGMDYLKICLGNMADLLDRQLCLIMSDKTSRGLPPNLSHAFLDNNQNQHLTHGLKGLHQLASAVTADILNKSIPNSIFSRSSESHNQDKVSLGFSASVQCHEIIQSMYNLLGVYFVCLTQALDQRGVSLSGKTSKEMYELVRKHVAYIKEDQRLDVSLFSFIDALKKHAREFSTIQKEDSF